MKELSLGNEEETNMCAMLLNDIWPISISQSRDEEWFVCQKYRPLQILRSSLRRWPKGGDTSCQGYLSSIRIPIINRLKLMSIGISRRITHFTCWVCSLTRFSPTFKFFLGCLGIHNVPLFCIEFFVIFFFSFLLLFLGILRLFLVVFEFFS